MKSKCGSLLFHYLLCNRTHPYPVTLLSIQSINSLIIPLWNIGRPQESSAALYSSRRT